MRAVIVTVFVSTACLCWSPPALSADWRILVGAGGAPAFGELEKRAGFGLHGLAVLEHDLVTQDEGGIALAVRTEAHRFNSDIATEGDFQFLQAGLDIRLRFRQKSGSTLYLLLGAGYARVERMSFTTSQTRLTPSGMVTTESKVPSRSESDPYATIGAGTLLAGSGGITPFVEIRLTDISGTYIRDYLFLSGTIGIKL
jgi:hypothetical protein